MSHEKYINDNSDNKILFKKNVSLAVVYAVTRIRTWVVAATTRSTNHYTITARTLTGMMRCFLDKYKRKRYLYL